MAFYGYPCTSCGSRDCDGCEEEPMPDKETLTILESRGARDESVGALTTEEWDDLACACEDVWSTRVVEAIQAIHEDERNKAIRMREAA